VAVFVLVDVCDAVAVPVCVDVEFDVPDRVAIWVGIAVKVPDRVARAVCVGEIVDLAVVEAVQEDVTVLDDDAVAAAV